MAYVDPNKDMIYGIWVGWPSSSLHEAWDCLKLFMTEKGANEEIVRMKKAWMYTNNTEGYIYKVRFKRCVDERIV